MLPGAFIKGYNQRRLRNLLAALFLALAVPTGVLIWQAFSQLKWESFYQYRVQAEDLTNRIDAAITAEIGTAASRGIADFAFLNSAPAAKIQQRSPLAAWPVRQDLPGLIGYFQVGADGRFSTPLLPATGITPGEVGLDIEEFAERQSLAGEIQTILAQNDLVRDRISVGRRFEAEPEEVPASVGALAPGPPQARAPAARKQLDDVAGLSGPLDEIPERSDAIAAYSLGEQSTEESAPVYDQQVFAQLNQPAREALANSADREFDDAKDSPAERGRANVYGKVRDLKLDDELQKKSEGLTRQLAAFEAEEKIGAERSDARTRRAERPAMTEALPSNAEIRTQGFDDDRLTITTLTITTFESEIDPYEFSLLDSGHLVFFRNAWRNGDRIIQGLLVSQDRFTTAIIETAFRATALSDMSNLVVGYDDDVIRLFPGGTYRSGKLGSSPTSAAELDGALLYRSRLSAPLDSLELIFTINQLPPGPGASVLGWTTVVIAMVFFGGFAALYRLGLSQIRLARQQQDFVSAVSHELKTPLTSIRMYGEMLKEGWADEAKRKQYYEYIHDESERLSRLISNVLQLAKISRNEPQFNLKPTTVNALMDQVRSKVANQVARAGFEFRMVGNDIPAGTSIRIDDDCFAQIIINLVDNAIKFSKNAENKTIEVGSMLTNDNRVAFTVRDYGPGIPGDQMRKIFKLFYRTESELTRETVGTGIGLAIVHQLTTAMHGKVDVVNQDPGAQFNVSFPSR